MSVKTKKRVKNIGKIIGIALFALLMFTNIKIATMDSSELASGDIYLFGIEVTLLNDIIAKEKNDCGVLCTSVPDHVCTYIVGQGFCFGYWR